MKRNDIVYVVDIDYKHPTIYKAKIIQKHKKWENSWLVEYIEVVIDFLNREGYTLEGQEGIYDADTHIYDTVNGCTTALIKSNYGIMPENIIKRVFR